MIHFQHPDLLYLLFLLPLLLVAWIWMQHKGKQRLAQFADKSMFGRLIPDASSWRPTLKFCLLLAALGCLILAIANPQMGSKLVKGEHIGGDVAICLDVSNSMMAEDIQPNRLERSKKVVANLMSQMAGDRISLVVFAGSSYIQMPLTNDYSAVKLFLDQIDCEMIATQGTAIGDAIEKAMSTFGYGDPDREWGKNKSRAIIVISDGENHEDDAEAAAATAAEEGILVCTIGMGLPEGAPIPSYRGGQRVGYKKDMTGNTVTTQLNEQMLEGIAHAGNGIYVRAGNVNADLQKVLDQIDKLEKSHYDDAMFSEYESRYQYPLTAAFLLLIAELLIFERRNRKINWEKIIGAKK